ncbi:hypothetical protein OVY29_22755 [Sphingopyxis sp. SE2]|nr:hypothetical protein [Sphingopyxis sp. SE2]MDT7531482.1 hypothetical protein [Sphingopyxis sp. SE2]
MTAKDPIDSGTARVMAQAREQPSAMSGKTLAPRPSTLTPT